MKTINYDKCRKLLKLFDYQGKKIRMNEIHEWINWIDTATLRKECHFAPFQKMVRTFENELIKDEFIAQKPDIQAKLSSILLTLNIHSSQWMETSSKRVLQWIENKQSLKIEDIMNVYKLLIEMGWNDEKTLEPIRLAGIKMLEDYVEKTNWGIVKMCGYVHKHLQALLLDPKITPQMLIPLISILRSKVTKPINLDENFGHTSTAIASQMLKILGFEVIKEESCYGVFLRASYQHYRKIRLSNQEKELVENSSKKFNRKGESIFQIRFQKNLQEMGYLFQRNKLIGIKEFDILLKGRLTNPLLPFQRLLSSQNISEIAPISSEELQRYQSSPNLWKVQNKQIWSEPILINLNGPFHQVQGDKEVILRSDQFNEKIAHFYGFRKFTTISSKHWQENTPNKASIEAYLKKLISPL